MTKQEIDEAVEVFRMHRCKCPESEHENSKMYDVLTLAIKALEQMKQLEYANGELPKKRKPMFGRKPAQQCDNCDYYYNQAIDEVTPIYLKVVAERDALRAQQLEPLDEESVLDVLANTYIDLRDGSGMLASFSEAICSRFGTKKRDIDVKKVEQVIMNQIKAFCDINGVSDECKKATIEHWAFHKVGPMAKALSNADIWKD